jgi:argininosuccinate lyase
VGNLVGLLTTLKGLPSTYDKDLQEDKEPLFDTYDTLGYTLPVMSGLIASLQLRPQMMARQLEPSLLATDLADYLVKKGLPFRQAHAVIGQVVRLAENSERPLTDLSLAELQELSPLFAADVAAVFSMEGALASRGVTGGTAPTAVLQQIATAQKLVNDE